MVNWDMVGALAEFGGATAVVVSLLYLARQMRHSTLQARVASFRSLSGRAADWRLALVSDQSASDVYRRGLADGLNSLDETERVRFILIAHGMMRICEEAHVDRSHDVWPAWAELLIEESLVDLMATKGYRDFWALRNHQYSAEFRKLVDDLDSRLGRAAHGQSEDVASVREPADPTAT